MAWKLNKLFTRKVVESVTPSDADKCFQRGNAHVSQQQWQSALQCYGEAARLNPNHAEAHAYSGNVLRQLQDANGALAAYDRAIAVKPDYAETHYNRGTLLHQARQQSAALASYDTALVINPGFAEAHCSRGDVLRELGRLDEAQASYKAAIMANGGYAKAYLQRGVLEQQRGQSTAAETSYRHAISLRPDYADAYAGLGTLQSAAGNHSDALMNFDVALHTQPNHARLVGNRAQALARLGRLSEARASYERAVVLDPGDVAIHFNRGSFLSDCKEWTDAIQSYQAAVALQPDYADAYCNLGIAQHEAAQEDAALQSYSRALALNPRLSTAYINRGNLFRSRQQFAESMQDLRRALELEPESVEANYNLGLLALLRGELAAGWPNYERRHFTEEARSISHRRFSQPAWFGEQSLHGKRILLHAEQGLGDTIQFCRYAASVAALGAQVTLEVQPALRGLLAGLDGVSELLTQGSPLPLTEFQCSVMSLPGAFKTTLDTIPRQVPYLRADPGRVTRCREMLGERTGARVGLAWSGNPLHTENHRRSVALAALMAHLPYTIEYYCLQNQIDEADRETLRSCGNIKTVAASMTSLDDTAALMETLDLIISVDTSLAHLSGALGKPTWILLPFFPDWRWMLDRKDSPWYPTASLYRQSAPGGWDGVLAQVAFDLRQRHASL